MFIEGYDNFYVFAGVKHEGRNQSIHIQLIFHRNWYRMVIAGSGNILAPGHYQTWCWSRSLSPYGTTGSRFGRALTCMILYKGSQSVQPDVFAVFAFVYIYIYILTNAKLSNISVNISKDKHTHMYMCVCVWVCVCLCQYLLIYYSISFPFVIFLFS